MNDDEVPDLVPTGRGSYVRVGKVTLKKILASYDATHPDYIDIPRDQVIAAYRLAERALGG